MKKLIAILCISFFALSCSENLEDNTPAVQGYKDGDIWQADFYAADIDFGGFVIEGGKLNERVQLFTSNDVRGTFNLGLESNNIAIYVDANGTVYSTKNAPDTSIFVSPPEGQIVVQDIDNLDPKGVIGTFWFNAYSSDGTKVVNFNRGTFYRVPLLGGLELIQN